jgi:hypothetical protein
VLPPTAVTLRKGVYSAPVLVLRVVRAAPFLPTLRVALLDPFFALDFFVTFFPLDFVALLTAIFREDFFALDLVRRLLVPPGGRDGRSSICSMSKPRSEFENASVEMLAEINREAEAYLAAQLTAGIAADQRAMSFIGLIAASATALGTGAGVLLLGREPSAIEAFIGVVLLSMAAGLLWSMRLAASSAKPSRWEYAGNSPENWRADIAACTDFHCAYAQQTEHYIQSIPTNKEVLDQNAKLMACAIRFAWLTLTLGGVIAVIALAFNLLQPAWLPDWLTNPIRASARSDFLVKIAEPMDVSSRRRG